MTVPIYLLPFAPPETILLIVSRILARPSIGPTVTPWSIGMITVFPLLRSIIRSSLIFLPIILEVSQYVFSEIYPKIGKKQEKRFVLPDL